jgi:hypothetical protein
MNKSSLDIMRDEVAALDSKARKAQLALARASLGLVEMTCPDSLDGRFSRMGALKASILAGDDELASRLLRTFLEDPRTDNDLADELSKIHSNLRDI